MSEVHIRVRAGGEHYALPVDGVREIAPLAQVTPVPGAPPEVLGVWNLRGDVIPAIDLARLLGLSEREPPTRIVVAEEADVRAGLVVEAVLDVGALPPAAEPADSPLLTAAVLIDSDPVGVIDLGAVLGGLGAEAG